MSEFIDPVGINGRFKNGVATARFSDPSVMLSVEFYTEPKPMGYVDAAGQKVTALVEDDTDLESLGYRPQFKDVEYIRIFTDSKSVHVREVTRQDKQVYKFQYDQFKAGQEQTADGTSLASVSFLSPAQIKELKEGFKIHTVEQFAGSPLERFAGVLWAAEKHREAKVFLEAIKDTYLSQKLAAQNQGLKDEVAELKAQVAALAAQQNEKPSKEKK